MLNLTLFRRVLWISYSHKKKELSLAFSGLRLLYILYDTHQDSPPSSFWYLLKTLRSPFAILSLTCGKRRIYCWWEWPSGKEQGKCTHRKKTGLRPYTQLFQQCRPKLVGWGGWGKLEGEESSLGTNTYKEDTKRSLHQKQILTEKPPPPPHPPPPQKNLHR